VGTSAPSSRSGAEAGCAAGPRGYGDGRRRDSEGGRPASTRIFPLSARARHGARERGSLVAAAAAAARPSSVGGGAGDHNVGSSMPPLCATVGEQQRRRRLHRSQQGGVAGERAGERSGGDGGAGAPPAPVVDRNTSRIRGDQGTGGSASPRTAAAFVHGASLSEYCTLGVGGPARLLVEVHTAEELGRVLRFAADADMPCVTLGRGSNVLFDDRGFDGIVAVNCIDGFQRMPTRADASEASGTGDTVGVVTVSAGDASDGDAAGVGVGDLDREEDVALFRVGAGYPLNQLGAALSREGWGGLEFAAGIPGTVGGAVFMNAGADGQDTAMAGRIVLHPSVSRACFQRWNPTL